MLIRPIPPVLLPNKVDYSTLSGGGRYGDIYDEPISLVNVRVVPKSQLKYASTNETLDFNSILYIDPHTSKQLDANGNKVDIAINPKEKDKITFDGVTYIIVNANELLVDANKIHHWECTLNRM